MDKINKAIEILQAFKEGNTIEILDKTSTYNTINIHY